MARINEKRTKAYRAMHNKAVVMTFRGTAAEKEQLEEAAKSEGRTFSDFIRRAVRLRAMKKKKPDPVAAELLAEIQKLRRDYAGRSANINHLTMLANKNGWLSDDQKRQLLDDAQSDAEAIDRLDRRHFGDDTEDPPPDGSR